MRTTTIVLRYCKLIVNKVFNQIQDRGSLTDQLSAKVDSPGSNLQKLHSLSLVAVYHTRAELEIWAGSNSPYHFLYVATRRSRCSRRSRLQSVCFRSSMVARSHLIPARLCSKRMQIVCNCYRGGCWTRRVPNKTVQIPYQSGPAAWLERGKAKYKMLPHAGRWSVMFTLQANWRASEQGTRPFVPERKNFIAKQSSTGAGKRGWIGSVGCKKLKYNLIWANCAPSPGKQAPGERLTDWPTTATTG